MKNRYRIYGTVQVDVAVEIEARSLEEAIEYAWDNYRSIEISLLYGCVSLPALQRW